MGQGRPRSGMPEAPRQRQAQATEQDTSKRVVLKPELVASRQRGSGNATARPSLRQQQSPRRWIEFGILNSVSRAFRSKWAQAACCQPSPKYRSHLGRTMKSVSSRKESSVSPKHRDFWTSARAGLWSRAVPSA